MKHPVLWSAGLAGAGAFVAAHAVREGNRAGALVGLAAMIGPAVINYKVAGVKGVGIGMLTAWAVAYAAHAAELGQEGRGAVSPEMIRIALQAALGTYAATKV